MKKPELIECILQMDGNLHRTTMEKLKKKELQNIYDSLISRNNEPSQKEKKQIKIIDFSSDEEGDNTDVVEESLPTNLPVLTRQNSEIKKISELDRKNEIKTMIQPFTREIKTLVNEYKTHKDKDMFLHEYEMLVKDTEDRLHGFLSSINANDNLYNYTADVMDITNRFVERITN